ncbi:hypothetical protein [Streptomyces sp. NPDC001165]|uniref:hypothetical protein n=1 Tax=Streptomyces sp. NPDC001165 TaxID=3364546 RepID=UPI0036B6AA4C
MLERAQAVRDEVAYSTVKVKDAWRDWAYDHYDSVSGKINDARYFLNAQKERFETAVTNRQSWDTAQRLAQNAEGLAEEAEATVGDAPSRLQQAWEALQGGGSTALQWARDLLGMGRDKIAQLWNAGRSFLSYGVSLLGTALSGALTWGRAAVATVVRGAPGEWVGILIAAGLTAALAGGAYL